MAFLVSKQKTKPVKRKNIEVNEKGIYLLFKLKDVMHVQRPTFENYR